MTINKQTLELLPPQILTEEIVANPERAATEILPLLGWYLNNKYANTDDLRFTINILASEISVKK